MICRRGDVVETADHGLVLTTFNSTTFEVELAKVNGKGEVIARRTIKGLRTFSYTRSS